MGKRKSKGGSKKNKSKKSRESNIHVDELQDKNKNDEQLKYEGISETTSKDNLKDDVNDINADSVKFKSLSGNSAETSSADTTNINDCCEEVKANQQELLNKLNNLNISLTDITSIRDNVNSIRVDTLTELYFTRQVRPLLDALNILSFSVSNMTSAAVNIQTNTFGDRKEIRHALNLSYKMNDEVEDVIDSLERRLKIFLNQISNDDKNCPSFSSGRDS